ncbi:MAG TPA: AAA family ATPase [Polyangia bacterium]|jgi:exodeoxyribonuclease V alpha subunit
MTTPPRSRRTASFASHPAAPLHPAGTARALFLGADAADPDDALPRALWERLRARDVGTDTLLSAWEVSRWVAAPIDERKALAGLLVALGEAVEGGSTFLPLVSGDSPDDAAPLAGRLVGLGFTEGERGAIVALAARLVAGAASPALASLFGAPAGRRPFVLVDGALYPEALWSFEARLTEALAARLARPRPPAPADVTAQVTPPATGPALGPEQLAAVEACLTHPLTLITGGPGTGKTSTIVALLRALFRGGVRADRVAIAAPTGRAAQRIAESLHAAGLADGVTTSTLHRLLGIRPSRRPTLDAEAPEFHAGWRLPHLFVIVDEASMIDLFMMTELLEAVGDEARLILVGDADQLPSVRLGAVFRDLCAALPALTRRLTTSYRMDPADAAGAAILRAAQGLQAGGDTGGFVTRRRADELDFTGVQHLPRAGLPELLARWNRDVLGGEALLAQLTELRFAPGDDGRLTEGPDAAALREALRRHAAARILCVTRTAGSAAGADALNAMLHRQYLWTTRQAAGPANDEQVALLPGEPVTILHNDYERGLWNGDQGVIVQTRSSGEDALGVVFARTDGLVIHALAEIADNVGLGFALTVHKAQGSEYDLVALVLPTGDSPLLTREILYTALTRARRGVMIVGELALFARGASRKLERASGLRDKLPRLPAT